MCAFHSVASYSPLPPFADEQQADNHCNSCASAQLVELQDGQKLSESQRCPVSSLRSQTESYMEDCYEHERHLHMQESDRNSSAEYAVITNCRQLLKGEILPVPASDHDVDRIVVMNAQDHVVQQFQVPLQSENGVHAMQTSFTMQQLGDAVASLISRLAKVEEKIHLLNTKFKEHDFRLSLIESSNHDGTMVWKIPQFSQRKADAENGKYTSLFSPPFYAGRYGYKMCLRLSIMGDGTGKGTHLSLFIVVMRGEFDNVLQWPFTHKVTFKLINQAGGRHIVNAFQPDPMSPSFKKPKSDMNVASGYPQFVSLVELERGGFVLDDTSNRFHNVHNSVS